ncbi:MAG: metal ABC transporter ATP-binding protein [Clostridia bacterium]|nr:metal ABC transporter ATP-binding protein [Clostridia bacterium]
MALITLKDVTIAFEGVSAVEGASFSVERGDYLVMIGENGSGKSTLIRAMLGLVHPERGSVSYGDGLRKNQIGYLPQQTAAQRDFPASVEEVVLSGCANRIGKFHFFYQKRHIEIAREKMALLDILPLRQKSYRTLSGGQQQRTLLARALCATDSILLLDEPVTGLDPATTDELYALIRRLNRECGVAIVMVSHDLHGAMQDANKVLVVDRGVSFYGTADEYGKNCAGERT